MSWSDNKELSLGTDVISWNFLKKKKKKKKKEEKKLTHWSLVSPIRQLAKTICEGKTKQKKKNLSVLRKKKKKTTLVQDSVKHMIKNFCAN